MTTGLGSDQTHNGRILVLGLGNEFMTDDAAGLLVARAIQSRLPPSGPVTVRESAKMGFALLDDLSGFESVLLIDAIQTGLEPPGYVHVLDPASLRTLPVVSPHFAGIGEMLLLGRSLDLSMPLEAKVLGIEVEDPWTFSSQLTPVLQASLDRIEDVVWTELSLLMTRMKCRLQTGIPAPA